MELQYCDFGPSLPKGVPVHSTPYCVDLGNDHHPQCLV